MKGWIVPSLRVRDLMTAVVFTVHPDDPLGKLRDMMDEKHIRHVPVVEADGALAGLVSERDLLRRASGMGADLPLSVQEDVLAHVQVREIMTWEVETVEADEEAAAAAETMLENKYGCLPVVEADALAGILTEADFVRAVATGHLMARPAGGRKSRE